MFLFLLKYAATSSCLVLVQRCGGSAALYHLPGLSDQGPKSVDTISVHYIIFEPVSVYRCSWEKGVLSLHGVAVGHSGLRPVIVSCIAVDWIGGFAVQLSCAN